MSANITSEAKVSSKPEEKPNDLATDMREEISINIVEIENIFRKYTLTAMRSSAALRCYLQSEGYRLQGEQIDKVYAICHEKFGEILGRIIMGKHRELMDAYIQQNGMNLSPDLTITVAKKGKTKFDLWIASPQQFLLKDEVLDKAIKQIPYPEITDVPEDEHLSSYIACMEGKIIKAAEYNYVAFIRMWSRNPEARKAFLAERKFKLPDAEVGKQLQNLQYFFGVERGKKAFEHITSAARLYFNRFNTKVDNVNMLEQYLEGPSREKTGLSNWLNGTKFMSELLEVYGKKPGSEEKPKEQDVQPVEESKANESESQPAVETVAEPAPTEETQEDTKPVAEESEEVVQPVEETNKKVEDVKLEQHDKDGEDEDYFDELQRLLKEREKRTMTDQS